MSRNREAERQQLLLGVLGRSTAPTALAGWARDGPRFGRGLQVYQANAGALAERALAAAYPVTAELLGAQSFAQLARALWQRQPPTRGDVATWGAGLADFLAEAAAAAEGLADEPCLPDVARLEWAVHIAASAADAAASAAAFDRMADTDPDALWPRVRPGTALLRSPHPVVSIWRAHRAMVRGEAETALVWRQGWQVHVAAPDAADGTFTQALLQGHSLGAALSAVSDWPGFDFEAWLMATLPRGWLLGFSDVKDGVV